MPTYWTEEIRRVLLFGVKNMERKSQNRRREIAKQLRNQGYSYEQIAEYLGVSKATIINWVKHNKVKKEIIQLSILRVL